MVRRIHLITAVVVCIGFATPVVMAGSAQAAEREPVTYRLKWLRNVSTAGDLYAESQGFFTDAGLRVTVKAGGPERDAIRELELGYAQFGVASADQVIRARAKGSPVVVILQLFQINPLQWMYRPDRLRIERLDDLRGRVLGVTFGGNDETILRTLMAKAGIRETEVTLFSVRYDYTPFFRRRVDIWPVYRNAQGVILADRLRRAGEPIAFFNPAEFGVRFVANSVVTTRRAVTDQPDTVRRFSSALVKGWTAAMDSENEARTIAVLQQYDDTLSSAILRHQLAITRKLVKPDADDRIGAIDTDAWRQTEQIMVEQGLIKDPVSIGNALFPFVTRP